MPELTGSSELALTSAGVNPHSAKAHFLASKKKPAAGRGLGFASAALTTICLVFPEPPRAPEHRRQQ